MATAKYPGWRTMTKAQRYNARMDRLIAEAKARGDWPTANGSWNAFHAETPDPQDADPK